MTSSDTGDRPGEPGRTAPTTLARILRPVMTVVAILYFLIDAIFLAALRPIGRAIARLELFARLAAWIQTVHPYVALALLAVPLALLEPAKPIGLYLMASGHAIQGVAVIVGAEIVKITLVERLFHISKDRLMTIPAFAWAYHLVMSWLDYWKATPAWQAVARRVKAIKQLARRISLSARRFARTMTERASMDR
jgi:hypothetical protein